MHTAKPAERSVRRAKTPKGMKFPLRYSVLKHIDDDAREHGKRVKPGDEQQILLHGAVCAEQHNKAKPCACAQPGHGAAKRYAALHKQLGEHDRRGAVGDQADKRGDKRLRGAAAGAGEVSLSTIWLDRARALLAAGAWGRADQGAST